MLHPHVPEGATMMPKVVKVDVEVPGHVSEAGKTAAQRDAHEAAVLALWQAGELTIRQAAEELGLNYYEFLDLLAERGIPVERGALNLEGVG